MRRGKSPISTCNLYTEETEMYRQRRQGEMDTSELRVRSSEN